MNVYKVTTALKEIGDHNWNRYIVLAKDMTYMEIINYFKKEINVDVSLGSLTTWFKVLEIPTRTWSLISKR